MTNFAEIQNKSGASTFYFIEFRVVFIFSENVIVFFSLYLFVLGTVKEGWLGSVGFWATLKFVFLSGCDFK